MPVDTALLISRILPAYRLEPFGLHGIAHWARVLENGLRLADETGADRDIVSLFAIFHDARRANDHHDPGHGRRGAELAFAMQGDLGIADRSRLDLFYYACERHTEGLVEGDISVQTCWDADRLDLPRVGVSPRSERLCTDPARNLISWARARAVEDYRPAILAEWGYGDALPPGAGDR